MRKVFLFLAVLFLVSTGVTATHAAVKKQIYFTKITTLTPTTYTFRFSLWDIASGGAEGTNRIWWEEKNITMTTTTLTTYLGTVTDPLKMSGSLEGVDFSEQYWVQVEQKNGSAYTPIGARTRFNMVPYAFWSAQGGDVSSVTAGDGLTSTGTTGDVTLNVGAGAGISVDADTVSIATGGVTSSMLAANAVTSGKLAANSVTTGKIADGTITDADISATAAIADTKLNTISTAGKVADSALSSNVVLADNTQTVTGVKTFSPSTGTVPFVVDATKTDVVTNLNADKIDGQDATAFAVSGHTHDTVYQKKYSKVTVVAQSGGDYTSALTAMTAIAAWCGTPSATNPCLLKIMPGVFDIGPSSLQMQAYVDIEGSGENTTKIKGNTGSLFSGVVKGASNAEVRFLSVENTGGGSYATAIYNYNVSPRLTNVTAIASNGTLYDTGVWNDSSSPAMTNIIATASGGTLKNYGVLNSSSSPTMTSVTATAKAGGTESYGVSNDASSSPTMTNVTAAASGGTSYNLGVFNNSSSSPTMTNVTATASGGSLSNYGVYNRESSPTMTNVTAAASGGTGNYGMKNDSASGAYTIIADRCTFEGSTNSISNDNEFTLRIGASKLIGTANIAVGTYIFSGAYYANGTVTAAAFVGDGSGLTNMQAAQISGLGSLATKSTVGSSDITDGAIVNADINASAAIADSKLATISTAGKVADTALSSKVVLTDNTQTISGAKTFSSDVTLSGNLNLPATTATTGIIKSGANRLIHTYGSTTNFFAGVDAGNLGTTGYRNTGSGFNSLFSNTTGYRNTANGAEALFSNNQGNYNTADGAEALYKNTAGNNNTAGGTQTLYSNTTGNNNTAVGGYALYWNTTGSDNVAGGLTALFNNTTAGKNTAIGTSSLYTQSFANSGTAWGSYNTAVGFEALYSNQPTSTSNGVYNTAVGSLALRTNTTGNWNTAGGLSALYSNTTASKNTAIGAASLYTQSYSNSGTTYDSHNTAVGFEALFSNQPTNTNNGKRNTSLGSQALRANTTGNNNTAGGAGALYSNTSGIDNVAVGVNALYGNTAATSNTAIGTEALMSQSFANSGSPWATHNTAVGFQALHSNNPSYLSDGFYNTALGSKALFANSTGAFNVACGSSALEQNTAGGSNTAGGHGALSNNLGGGGNTALGTGALSGNIFGSYNTAIGFDANVESGDLTNATAIGANARVNISNKVVIGNSSVISIGGYQPWSNFSDMRSKTDIQDLGYGLDLIKQLRPVSFKMKNGNNNTDFGFVAQDIEALLGTQYNVLDIGGGEERMLSLRYSQFIAPMVKAMQEQQEMIEEQRSQLQTQRTMIEQLMAELTELKKRFQ
jgi:trimeric autotransporter adhesin